MQSHNMRDALHGKTAVVTGGSSGIGAASVRALAAEGARVVIGYHNGEDRAAALCASLPGEGHRIARIALDEPDTHAALADELRRDDQVVSVLVNCAGYTTRIPHTDIEQLDGALFNQVLLANAGGTYSIVRALLPLMQASGDATVVSVSSVAAFTGSGSNIAYCAAKAAIDTMTLSLARAFGPRVRFLCVSPASVDTDFVPGRSREDVHKKAESTPLGRAVTAEDVACAVIACVTHLRTATGTRLVIDGGFTLT